MIYTQQFLNNYRGIATELHAALNRIDSARAIPFDNFRVAAAFAFPFSVSRSSLVNKRARN